MRQLIVLLFLCLSFQSRSDVVTHVLDTGAGLATVTTFPDGDVMVYDTGRWTYQKKIFERFQSIIGDHDIDLLIVSHTDADHLSTTDELFNEYRVHEVLRTGMNRPNASASLRNHVHAIESAAHAGLTHDINLATVNLPFGTVFDFGDAKVQFLAGFEIPPSGWALREGSADYNNAGSIVVRVVYGDHSILFTGDEVGHHDDDPDDAPAVASERFLIDNSANRPIASTVMIAPHHGSNDASSGEFIQAVAARWVIFSAGHMYDHPRAVAVQRYLDLGYAPGCLLRTDLGDDESDDGDDEWGYGRVQGEGDKAMDDEVVIRLPDSGEPQVSYLDKSSVACPQVITASVPTDVSTQIIKKSRSGICHTPASQWYTRTKNFSPFDDLESCLASGGRIPR